MRLNDEQIERYSRQLILPEVGPLGQERLLAARVAIHGTGVAAERVVAYLAAAGVGWIAADVALHVGVDPDQPDVTVVALGDAGPDAVDAAVVVAPTCDDAADALARSTTRTAATLWIAGGRAGASPPCPRCAAAATSVASVPPELRALRDGMLGSAAATEVVKTLLAIGTPLAGRVLTYDPVSATVATTAVTPRPRCCGEAG